MLVHILNEYLVKMPSFTECERNMYWKCLAFLSHFSPLQSKGSLLVFGDISPVGVSVK